MRIGEGWRAILEGRALATMARHGGEEGGRTLLTDWGGVVSRNGGYSIFKKSQHSVWLNRLALYYSFMENYFKIIMYCLYKRI